MLRVYPGWVGAPKRGINPATHLGWQSQQQATGDVLAVDLVPFQCLTWLLCPGEVAGVDAQGGCWAGAGGGKWWAGAVDGAMMCS